MAFHPLAVQAARRRAVDDAVAGGAHRLPVRRKIMALTDAQVEGVMTEKCAAAGVVPPEAGDGVGKIGDGEIIKAVDEFCKAHPELVAAIAKGLLLLVGL